VLLELLGSNGATPPTLLAELPAPAPADQLLTVQEVADRFGLTPDWLYRHWKAVGGVKLGRKVLRFPANTLPRYLAARRKAR
jgi:predicted DNA-binding transcriptional regulator AlpA